MADGASTETTGRTRGEFHTLLGPSGSGKTTLLKIVAGFTPADGGEVTLADRSITNEPPENRNIGVVFQNYALVPHMTVEENIGFGLRMRRVAKSERAERVAEDRRRGMGRPLPVADRRLCPLAALWLDRRPFAPR